MNALVVSADTELKATIQRLCASRIPAITIVRDMPGMPRLDPVTTVVPDFIFFDARGEQQDALASLERVAARYPQAMIVLMAPEQSPDLLIAAMRLGVREVVSFPVDLGELDKAIERISSKMRDIARDDGKVLTLVSSKGGSGTTFVAVNLAYALAGIAQKRALLIDLNLQFGDAALFVSDAKPPATMTDLCQQIARLDAQLLDASVIHAASGFDVLAASSDPDPDDSIRPDHLAGILALARQQYDFVLLDAGRQINAVTIRALDSSDLIFPVLQQSLPFIRNGQRMLEMFSTLGYRKENIRQILNRHDESGPLTQGEMERSLGHRIAYTIPNNFEIASESINQGEPVLKLARSSHLAKGFVRMAQSLTATSMPSSPGLIRRLFVRHAATANS
jgi:pilus assembly protein CpaE